MNGSNGLTKIAALLLVGWMGLVTTGCATADMGYTTYTSADDWSEKTKTGPQLPLAKTADVWSEPKTFNTSAGPLDVSSRFLKQQATTCTFEVKFTNNTPKQINRSVSLTARGKEK